MHHRLARFVSPFLALALAASTACSSSTDPDAGADVATDTITTDSIAPGDATDTTTSQDTAATDAAVDAAPTDSAPFDAGCTFDDTYSYGNEGGKVAYTESSTIAPADSWTRTRMPASGTPITCMQTVPCGTSGRLDVNAVMNAIHHQDVQAALSMATPPLYGIDSRPVDGSVFVLHRASDGHSFMVGSDCGGASGCTPIPAGISSLVTMLRNLDTQELAEPGCEALRL